MGTTTQQQLKAAEEVIELLGRKAERLQETLSLQIKANKDLMEQRNKAMSIIAEHINRKKSASAIKSQLKRG